MKNFPKQKVLLVGIIVFAIAVGGICIYKNETKKGTVDATCVGEKDPNYNLGYGVEHTYHGKITENKPVSMVLSCDLRKLTMTGAVSQIFVPEPAADGFDMADLINGTEVVRVADDYNFDGYNDLASLVSNGSQVDTYVIYLYNLATNQFVFSKQLSDLENVSPDPVKKEIVQEFNMGMDQEPMIIRWQWKDGVLVKIK